VTFSLYRTCPGCPPMCSQFSSDLRESRNQSRASWAAVVPLADGHVDH